MIPLVRISLFILIFVRYVYGDQKVIHVSDRLVTSDSTFNTGGENGSICCVYGNCTCNSLDHAVANLTSNVLINITTDVTLSSLIKVSNLENISIIGHNNPTVNCKSVGGLHFTFCQNYIVQGITWNECGTEDVNNYTEPGLALSYSTNITIKSCFFQYSKGQAVLLSAVSGNINISYCSFIHNSQYRGHGAAIHYSSSNLINCQQVSFAISDCNFMYNKHAESLVYIENKIPDCNNNIIFHSSKFCHNQGSSVYAISQNIYFAKRLLFQNNTGKNGTGIYIRDYSNVIFGKNLEVTFIQNFANLSNGIVFLSNNSSVIFNQNSLATFDGNTATNGIIYSEMNSSIFFLTNCKVVFQSNQAKCYGAAIYSYSNSNVIFTGNSNVTFDNNVVSSSHESFAYCGGTIYSKDNSYISFEGNSNIMFTNNTAYEGGAIYADSSLITFKDNSSTLFNNNTAGSSGGAITCEYGYSYCNVSFKGISTTIFSNNIAHYGGAIAMGNSFGQVSFEDFSTTIFSHNIAKARGIGGAIYSASHFMSFKANSTTHFSNNIANSGGGLCFVGRSHVSFEDSSATVFTNNTAADYGGAIAIGGIACNITFRDDSTVMFTNNSARLDATVHSSNRLTIMVIGNSTVLLNNHLAKWCNKRCLQITNYNQAFRIGSNGEVWCLHYHQESFTCLSKNHCNCKELEGLLDGLQDNMTVNITGNVTLSSVIELSDLENISIIGHNNITVFCGADGGGLYMSSCSKLKVEGITWMGCGIKNISVHKAVMNFSDSSGLTIQNCTFQYTPGQVISFTHIYENVNINYCNFMNNERYRYYGSKVDYVVQCTIYFASTCTVNVNNCNFSYNSGSSLYFGYSSDITHIYLNNSSYQNNRGTSLYLLGYNYILHISGEVLLDSSVAEDGPGIYVYDNSTVIFDTNSNVKFVNNKAYRNGAAIWISNYSGITFEHNSAVTFNDNFAYYHGTIYSEANSNVIFKDACEVTFLGNFARQRGSAICSFGNSSVIFTGNSKVNFSNNVVDYYYNNYYYYCNSYTRFRLGGTILSDNNGYIAFEENSFVVFNNNTARVGAAIFSVSNSSVTFKGRSRIMFNNNIAHCCGVLTSDLFSSITFNDNTEVTFHSNEIPESSYVMIDYLGFTAAMCVSDKTDVIFAGFSSVTFTNNTVNGGGAVAFSDSDIIIKEYSMVIFINNIAQFSFGAAFTCYNSSNVTVGGNSNVSFISNKANQDGGAIYSTDMCKITFKDNSTSTFINNTARNNGGAISASDNSSITSAGKSVLSFINNEALRSGGAGYLNAHCNFIVDDNAMVTFNDNKASHGGAICINETTKLMFKENSTTSFQSNVATVNGGAVNVITNSSITLKGDCTIQLNDNIADYGGAIFLDTTYVMVNGSDNYMQFTNNIARIFGNSLYQAVPQLYNSTCINDKVVGISNKLIATPPNELKFYDPAICIDDDNDTQCNNYYVQNIMLGREIVVPACVLGYYNQPLDSMQFLVKGEKHPNFFISGQSHVLISCDTFEGIMIVAHQSLLKSVNFTINITLNNALYTDWKHISVNLTIELSSCPPGFWQYPKSEKCECYNANDVVFCSGSNSTIKRGYWFGSVTGKPTVAVCPINYCNFTCCEASNGYYHLSPVRGNQCRSRRSGTACGSCTDGYTLSFDSTECVSVENCIVGHTVLVLLLSITYWIVMVASVFAIMYYKVGIGYLYGITYYYSIVDILLSQNLHVNRGLYLTVSMMSSFSKITPQFLGELCFTTGMSGIDQQFIHYMHPLAVILILGVISLTARISQRISAFISRGIIHVICLLILLSYTSITSTSLLLMRSLTFHGIDKVYTYLSPDIEYFHGRHSAYGIVALLCIISIVAGLPLLLTLEPFLNRKFNFTKIKPLLDQFQGCYKDKYRCFAGYYMICRLLIITIVIAKSADDFVANYILIVVCGITEFIHVMVKPYNKELLNKLDTVILRLIIFITVLSLSDDFDSPFIITIAVMLVISPLLILIAITLFLHKHNLRKMIKSIKRFAFKDESPSKKDVSKNEMPVREFNLVVDDSMRENNTIFDV